MSDNFIDLRSDTVTKPTGIIRNAMAVAEVGDDVYGEDPTVNRLQDFAAELAGKEAALFVPSGTMGNLIALLTHCGRGEEYICGQSAHLYRLEGGGAAALGGIVPQPLDYATDGTLDLASVREAVKPPDHHFARSRLLCLENTQDGKVLPLAYQEAAGRFAAENDLALHLDGARVCNAAVALGVDLETVCRPYDSVSLCLSKGLGAPVGSVLLGSKAFIEEAHRWRKVCGGGMRQAGIVAEAGYVALRYQTERLAMDHGTARTLAEGLADIEGLSVNLEQVQTNMVFVDCPAGLQEALKSFLAERGILVGGYGALRLVTHLDILPAHISTVIAAFREFFARD
ncbi:MAG: low-specificity L-threonine aldolase [Desulfuromonadales bacterium]|nr:low-specificity L-threonine aldolase [Desulfuromonadales bacterium]NIR33549.1 low-specificity L-threonine aldolase [Desulfuromonadales bacterium]NIS41139.1 low-specificity L-threonine aldolase [Desulfuromonadales bacterium]